MTNDVPDWVRMVQLVVTVNTSPVVVDDVIGAPAGGVGRYSGTDTNYQTVTSWTISADKTGRLNEISLRSNNYNKTQFEVDIGDTVFKTNMQIDAALTLPFPNVALAAAKIVAVKCKSTDGTPIVVNASITGKEVG